MKLRGGLEEFARQTTAGGLQRTSISDVKTADADFPWAAANDIHCFKLEGLEVWVRRSRRGLCLLSRGLSLSGVPKTNKIDARI